MSTLESDLLQTERVGDDPPPQDPPAETPQGQADPPQPADDDAAIEAQAINLPDGERLVPLSAVAGARQALKAAKDELATLKPSAERATQLEQQIQTLQSQIAQMQPVVQAYQAYVAAQRMQPQAQPPQAQDEDAGELEAIARDFDFYKPDATLDLDKARRHLTRVRTEAQRVAQQAVAPMERQTVAQQSQYMLERAMNTQAPNGTKPDPQILRQVWSRVDPSLAATKEGAMHLWTQALGLTLAMQAQQQGQAPPSAPPPPQGQRDAQGRFVGQAAQQPPPPIYTPPAGGKTSAATMPLSPEEQRFLKQTGMTEQEYMESAARMPGGRR